MNTQSMRRSARSVVALLGLFLHGCAEEEIDEAGAEALWQKIQSQQYQSWQRAPGYDSPQPTLRAHGETALVFVNPTVGAALESTGLAAWPEGSLFVKDSFKGDTHSLVAALEKQGGSWFYAEWSPAGEAKYAGTPDVCTGCHTANNDHVRAVKLP